MIIAAAQFAPVWEDRQANYLKVRDFANQARAAGALWLVLPEMFATGFSMNPALTAEEPDGPTSSFMRELAQEFGLGVLGGLVLKGQGGRGRNSALAVGPDGQDLALYTKSHLFAYMGEHKHHQAGEGPVPFAMGSAQASCFICYDLRFPELFRLVAESCQLVVVIASWPAARQRHWDLLLPARAVENQCYVVGLNRVGEGGGHSYTGGSVIYDPAGRALAQGHDHEKLLLAEIQPGRVSDLRSEMPFLKDRRDWF